MEKKKNILIERAKEAIRLCEERGVAAFKWKNEIKEILEYITVEAKKRFQDGRELRFYVPESITNKITFLKDCKLLITFNNSEGDFGNGSFGSTGNVYVDDNFKLNNTFIKINGKCDSNGNIRDASIIPVLYHELNHAYHCFVTISNKKSPEAYNRSAVKATITQNEVFEKHPILRELVYRLFSETEFNAFICDFYGEVKAKNIDRSEFSKKIKDIGWYRVYSFLLESYEDDIDYLTDNECIAINKLFESVGIKILRNSEPFNSIIFKTALKNKIKNKFSKLIKNIGRAVSLWFDEKETNDRKYLEHYIIPTR